RRRQVSYRPVHVYQSGWVGNWRKRIGAGQQRPWRARAPSQPHELEALRARVGHPQVADERDESALSMMRATRTDGGGLGVEGGDAQGSARRGTGNLGGTGFET